MMILDEVPDELYSKSMNCDKNVDLKVSRVNGKLCSNYVQVSSSAKNNSRPLAIFRPISAFGQLKSILIGQLSHTFSVEQH